MALAVAAGLAAGCAPQSPEHVYRYRLTLHVEADGQVHTGSSVVEVGLTSPEGPFHLRTRVRGEATVVELGDGRVLAALLDGPWRSTAGRNDGTRWLEYGPEMILLKLYGLEHGWIDHRNAGLIALAQQRGAHELTREQLPYLVAFSNGDDPSTLQIVSPADLSVLGRDVRIRAATLEATDAAVTERVEQALPWLKHRRGYLHGQDTCLTSRDTSPSRPFCPSTLQFRRAS